MKSRSQSAGDCREQLDALFGYLDGELTPEARQAVERHLRECVCCGNLSQEVERAVALCRTLGVRVPRAVHARASRRARALLTRPINPGARTVRRRTR